MQRITKRNENGTVSVDIENLLAERLAQFEDLELEPKYIAALDVFYHDVIDGCTCQNCLKNKDCEYLPKWGDKIRWNCPHWESNPPTDEEVEKRKKAWGKMEEDARKECEGKMTIHKCDRCGKIIEDYESNSRDQEYIISRMTNSPPDISADCDIDLCEDCYKQLLSWMQGMNLISDKRIEATEKEIPLLPVYKNFTYESGYFCGVCDHLVSRDFVYCPICGQKIKWEGNEVVDL